MAAAMLSVVLLALSIAAATAAQRAQRSDAAANCVARGGGLTAKRGTICYEFFDEEAVWVDARNRCRNYNASLVSVTSDDVQRWLETALEQFLPSREGVWIGLNDRRDEGTYMWDDVHSTDREARYYNWRTGEPNDMMLGQDCVYMRKTYKWQWVDVECALPLRRYSFVCAIEPRATADVVVVKEEHTLPMRTPSVDVSLVSISRAAQATGPKHILSLERGTYDKTLIGKNYSAKDSQNTASIATNESPDSGHSRDFPIIDNITDRQSEVAGYLLFAALAVLALVGFVLLTYFIVYRNPARLARLKAAVAASRGRCYKGEATKKVAPPAKGDIESKSHLLARAERQSSSQDARLQSRSNGDGDGRAIPNTYVTFGEATPALSVRPSFGISDEGPVYAELVEPLR